jgi:hypothetical protein
MPLWYLN